MSYRWRAALLSILFSAFCIAGIAQAAQQNALIPAPAGSKLNRIQKVNAGTVGVISGGIGGTYIRIATDLSSVLDSDKNNVRILPIAGKGSIQNITDLLYLKGIDVAIVQADVLTYIRDKRLHGNINNRVHYITKLYNEEFHLVTRKNIRNVNQLRGRRVNFGNKGSGTFMTSSVVFKGLGIPVQVTTFDTQLALEKLKRGEIDAMIYVAGKPASVFTKIKPEDGLKVLPVPYTAALQATYLPSNFTDADYPGLVPPGRSVDTIAVGAVMAVFNWRKGTPRYYKVGRFIRTFFDNFEKFQKKPRHPKWREVNLNAKLPGWTRYEEAREWLAKHSQNRVAANAETPRMRELRKAFKAFLRSQGQSAGLTSRAQDELFARFLKWQEASGQ